MVYYQTFLFIVSQGANNNIKISELKSPLINPLEPILIGYLDDRNINYNLVRDCFSNLFTNQINKNFIQKSITIFKRSSLIVYK